MGQVSWCRLYATLAGRVRCCKPAQLSSWPPLSAPSPASCGRSGTGATLQWPSREPALTRTPTLPGRLCRSMPPSVSVNEWP